jgi:hypothetical protein
MSSSLVESRFFQFQSFRRVRSPRRESVVSRGVRVLPRGTARAIASAARNDSPGRRFGSEVVAERVDMTEDFRTRPLVPRTQRALRSPPSSPFRGLEMMIGASQVAPRLRALIKDWDRIEFGDLVRTSTSALLAN